MQNLNVIGGYIVELFRPDRAVNPVRSIKWSLGFGRG